MEGMHKDTQVEGALPWSWIYVSLTSRKQMRVFEHWWSWRIRDKPMTKDLQGCPICKSDATFSAWCITNECGVAAQMLDEKDLDARDLSIPKKTPAQFVPNLTSHYH